MRHGRAQVRSYRRSHVRRATEFTAIFHHFSPQLGTIVIRHRQLVQIAPMRLIRKRRVVLIPIQQHVLLPFDSFLCEFSFVSFPHDLRFLGSFGASLGERQGGLGRRRQHGQRGVVGGDARAAGVGVRGDGEQAAAAAARARRVVRVAVAGQRAELGALALLQRARVAPVHGPRLAQLAHVGVGDVGAVHAHAVHVLPLAAAVAADHVPVVVRKLTDAARLALVLALRRRLGVTPARRRRPLALQRRYHGRRVVVRRVGGFVRERERGRRRYRRAFDWRGRCRRGLVRDGRQR